MGKKRRWRDQQYTTGNKGGETEAGHGGISRHYGRGTETSGRGYLVEGGLHTTPVEDVGSS